MITPVCLVAIYHQQSINDYNYNNNDKIYLSTPPHKQTDKTCSQGTKRPIGIRCTKIYCANIETDRLIKAAAFQRRLFSELFQCRAH